MGIAVHDGALVIATIFEEDLAETVGLVIFPATSVYFSWGLSYVALSFLPALYQFLAASDVVRGQLMHFLADIGGNFGLFFRFSILIQRPGWAYGPPWAPGGSGRGGGHDGFAPIVVLMLSILILAAGSLSHFR